MAPPEAWAKPPSGLPKSHSARQRRSQRCRRPENQRNTLRPCSSALRTINRHLVRGLHFGQGGTGETLCAVLQWAAPAKSIATLQGRAERDIATSPNRKGG